MLRGAQKQMIVVRTRDSRLFEEAYFVMRRGRPEVPAGEEDMLWEANRIIERSLCATDAGPCPSPPEHVRGNTEAGASLPGRRRRIRSALIWFFSGCLCGGGASTLVWLLH